MDTIKKVEELVKELTSNEEFRKEFMKDPVKSLEGKLDVDLPDEEVHKIVEGVKAKINLDGMVDGVKDKLGDLFHKEDK